MRTNRLPYLGFLTTLVICCSASKSIGSTVELSNFKVDYLKTYPKILDSSSSLDFGWTPQLDLTLIVLRGEISLFGAKRSPNSSFLISNYEAFAGLKLLPLLRIEAGGGLQNWHGQGGVSPVVTGGVVLDLGTFLDRIYFNYSYVLNKNNETKILKLGMGLNL